VHRLWEPLEVKRRPPNAYAAKFSVPFCVAYAALHGAVGLEAFTEENARDARIVELAAKVGYRIDPRNPYPDEFTGHVRVTLADGRVLEERQPHLRGGAREPLARADIEEKFRANCAHGGLDRRSRRALAGGRRARIRCADRSRGVSRLSAGPPRKLRHSFSSGISLAFGPRFCPAT
jgi:2-methylcitrate dehydratase PrpD